MSVRRRFPWGKRVEEPSAAPSAAPAQSTAPPLPRPPAEPHHWLTVVVARPGPAAPVPAAGASVVVRPFPRGAARPLEPVARVTASADGSVALCLPEGRYAVSARHEGEGRAVTLTLEHAGRALLLLEALGRRAVLTVEAADAAGAPLSNAVVAVRAVPTGTQAGSATTDERGVASLQLPPGAYEVRVGETVAKTYVEADTLLRLTAEAAPDPAAPPSPSRYAMRARTATSYVAPFDVAGVRDDVWN